MTDLRTISGDELRAIRKDLGLTQPEMAQLMNVIPGTIKRWEAGHRKCEGSAVVVAEELRENGRDSAIWRRTFPDHAE